ncbi:MAG TPA: Lrp/AsnC family transcriptional regulator [Rudaea sp.]|nr:Lrp/AsnC family transcriptional regulator [Rudaea sp.]
MTRDLDEFDRRILAVLQKDNKTALRAIGERVHLSAASVQRRIARMERAGTIAANVAVVDPAHVGRELTIVVEVEVESERPDLIGKTRKALAAAAEVQQCYYVTGDVDFVLIVSVATMAEYEAFTQRVLIGSGNIKRFRTLVAMERTKVGLAVPLRR